MLRLKKNNQSGFSLLELSIVLMISGVLLASGLRLYDSYQQRKRIHDTQSKIDTITEAFSRYFAIYGFYPCPASRTAAIGSNDFGVATNCKSSGVPAGTSVSTRTFDHDNNTITPNITRRVRVGSIPFVDLRDGLNDPALGYDLYESPYPITANNTIDSFGNRFTYALTEAQGTEKYIENAGAIIIRDEFGKILSSNSDYVVISHGKDGKGAVRLNGTPTNTICTGVQTDVENCDNDFEFIDSLRYDSETNYFDDQLVYRDWMAFFLWDVLKNAPEHVYNINAGNVGIGLTFPKQKLHVSNGNARASNALMTKEICDQANGEEENLNGEDCFSSDYIAGTALPTCPSGHVAVGIAEKALNCVPLYNNLGIQKCPRHQYITGFSYKPLSGELNIKCTNDRN